MNTKELWAYREALKILRRANERLEEYESVIYSPNGSRSNGMPYENGNNSPDRLAPIAEKHKELLQERDDARLRVHEAYKLLEEFEKTLTGDEIDVLHLRYRKGMTLLEIEPVLHRCERTLRRANNRIKEKFRKF